MIAQPFRLASRSRLASSRSTASRRKSVLSSPSRLTASIRARVPLGSGATILSGQSNFRPTFAGVSESAEIVNGVPHFAYALLPYTAYLVFCKTHTAFGELT
jgi:hypothetical protein